MKYAPLLLIVLSAKAFKASFFLPSPCLARLHFSHHLSFLRSDVPFPPLLAVVFLQGHIARQSLALKMQAYRNYPGQASPARRAAPGWFFFL